MVLIIMMRSSAKLKENFKYQFKNFTESDENSNQHIFGMVGVSITYRYRLLMKIQINIYLEWWVFQ